MSNKNETSSKSTTNPSTEAKTSELKPELQQSDSGLVEKPVIPASNPSELSKEVEEGKLNNVQIKSLYSAKKWDCTDIEKNKSDAQKLIEVIIRDLQGDCS